MKRTTYILIGLLASGLVVSVLCIIVLSVVGRQRSDSQLSIEGKIVEMDMTGIRVLKAFANRGELSESVYIAVNGRMKITSSLVEGERKLSYPTNEYLNVRRGNDTLFVEVDLKKYHFPKTEEEHIYSFLKIDLNLQLSVDSTLKAVMTDLNQMEINVGKMKTDSLLVSTSRQKVLLDSCQLRSLTLTGSDMLFHASKSRIENLYLHMDGIANWTFEDTEVGTEFLFGFGNHSNNIQKGECRRMVWTPLSNEARLDVTLREKATITIEPQSENK